MSDCTRCEGKGWFWRTPDGFNPFKAGGFATARAMYRELCGCPDTADFMPGMDQRSAFGMTGL